MIDRAERLKVVSRHGVGYDNIDVAALTARGIPLAIAADANATAVAEHTLFFMLALAKQGAAPRPRRCAKAAGQIRNRFETVDLMGRRVLIMGYRPDRPRGGADAAPRSTWRSPSTTPTSRRT